MSADRFGHVERSVEPVGLAPDGMVVHLLAVGDAASMAQFTLGAGRVARAIRHRTIEEYWFVTAGTGEVWFDDGSDRPPLPLREGVSLRVPARTRFQVRAGDGEPLVAVGVTIPPWPGDDEAELVDGLWEPTVD